jgi:CheY-like chemotaxis protein
MHPYFHPTTILVLDDEPLFLESFKFHFGGDFPCVSYTQPERAIEHIISQDGERPTFERSPQSAVAQYSGGERSPPAGMLSFSAADILRLTNDPNRFRRVSVLIADFDMPSMTGVQACRALRHLPVRKLLLTGKAGMDTAIAAFNEGVIDGFLTKHDPEIAKVLPRHVRRLQEDYFRQTTETLHTALSRDEFAFLTDPGFLEAFAAITRKQKIVEYYLSDKPTGMLLITESGKPLLLVLRSADSMCAQHEIAKDNGAPAELVSLLEDRRIVPVFPTESGYYEPELKAVWSRHVFPSQKLDDSDDWSYTLLRPSQAGEAFPKDVVTFAEFDEKNGASKGTIN